MPKQRPDDEPVLTSRQLQRAVLARQLLLQRADVEVPEALDLIAGLQSQYAPTMYVGCWSRMTAFRRDDLTAALERRTVVQGTMMRATIHLVSAADYWPLNQAIRHARRTWWFRSRRVESDAEMEAVAERVRDVLADDGRLTHQELEAIVGPDLRSGIGLFVDLVRVPPSGTWARRRADLYAAAEEWVGPPPPLTDGDATDHLVRRYLSGFGPATVNEIANWGGLTVGDVKPSLERLPLRRFRAEDGKLLVDLPDLPLPDADTPAPSRFLSTWEAILLVHARRTGVLREDDRPKIFSAKTPHSFNTFLVDGVVGGTWRFEDGRVELSPFRPVPRSAQRELTEESAHLADFHR